MEAATSELMERLRGGDAGALHALYDRHAPSMFQYGLFLAGDRQVAEDLVQECFIQFLRKVREGGVIDEPRAYLIRSVRNLAFNRIRDRRREEERRAEFGAWLKAEVRRPEHAGRDLEDMESFYLRLADLPREQREVVALKVLAGHTFEDIADVTESSLSTTYKRYQLAIQKLKETWSDPEP